MENQPNYSKNPTNIRFNARNILVAVVVILLAIYLGFLYNRRHNSSLNYDYRTLSKVSYKGNGKAASDTSVGINISQPAEFHIATSKTPAYNAYAQRAGSTIIGGSFMTSISLSSSEVQKEAATQKAAFAKGPTTDRNPPISQGLLRLVQVWIPGTTVHITGSSSLKTVNISDNAWLLTFSATSTDKSIASPLKGEIVFALGKKGEYIYTVYAFAHNWDRNTAIWKQMIDSLQLDEFHG